MIVVLVVVVALVAAAVGAVGARWHAARQVAKVAARVQPEQAALPAAGLGTELDRLEKAAARELASPAGGRAVAERLQAALDALPIGVVVADEDGAPRTRNAAADRFLGVRHADVLVDAAVEELLRAAVDGGRNQRQTLELFGPPARCVVVRAGVVRGDRSRFAIATIEDVTERQRLESVRTDFVANVSHELKTPVGALALLAEALVGEDDPGTVDRVAEKMVAEAHRVARIIEDLLELSRIELGAEPVREIVAVARVFDDAVERVRHLADHREVKVAVHDGDDGLSVLGDRRQIVSALANLVENAIKYSDIGSVVEVAARPDGDTVAITVTDHGIGIPARDLDRVFERFYRVDRARSRETGGTGLGLAIVRHVATNHGGSVAVTSEEGVGSTFTLRLPGGPR